MARDTGGSAGGAVATQAEAEAGTANTLNETMTPLRVSQAIIAQAARVTKSQWYAANGQGSTDTAIQKFTTEYIASDDVVVTVVNSSVNGFTVTANIACRVHIDYSFQGNASTTAGFSLNSTQLTTAISTITDTDKIIMANTNAANDTNAVSTTIELAIGDVLRTHCAGTANGSVMNRTMVLVTAIEII